MPFSKQQIETLMRPLKQSRVSQRKQGGQTLSYLEAWDVKAHLTRIFGFGGWDSLVSDIHLISCEKNEKGNYDACYQVTVTLIIRNPEGYEECRFAEAAVGSASLPRKGEALDMAIKTAESDALKRAAINLGTQFGLSLYNSGALRDVIGVLVPETMPEHPEAANPPECVSESETVSVPPEVLAEFMQIAGTSDNAQRILDVASMKERHKEHLHKVVEVDGQEVTLARYADRIGVGEFVEK